MNHIVKKILSVDTRSEGSRTGTGLNDGLVSALGAGSRHRHLASGGIIARLRATIAKRKEQRHQDLAIARLGKTSPHLLDDIGMGGAINRDDVQHDQTRVGMGVSVRKAVPTVRHQVPASMAAG
jgi:hypothetical protein